MSFSGTGEVGGLGGSSDLGGLGLLCIQIKNGEVLG